MLPKSKMSDIFICQSVSYKEKTINGEFQWTSSYIFKLPLKNDDVKLERTNMIYLRMEKCSKHKFADGKF